MDIGCRKLIIASKRRGFSEVTFIWASTQRSNYYQEQQSKREAMHVLVKSESFWSSHPSNGPHYPVRIILPFLLSLPLLSSAPSNKCRYSTFLHNILSSCLIIMGVRFNANLSKPFLSNLSTPNSFLSSILH